MLPPTGQKARMLAGEPYFANDPELVAAHLRAQAILARFNASPEDAEAERRVLLTELCCPLPSSHNHPSSLKT